MWLRAFILTQLIEMPIYFAACRGTHFTFIQKMCIAFGASALTHPVVWSLVGRLSTEGNFWLILTGAEAFAVITEGLFLRVIGVKKSYVWALVANCVSFVLGLTLEDFIL